MYFYLSSLWMKLYEVTVVNFGFANKLWCDHSNDTIFSSGTFGILFGAKA